MPTSLIIFDDFLENPYEIRDAALSLEYPPPPTNAYYPGSNSRQRLMIDGLDDRVSALAGAKLKGLGAGTGHAHCRLTLAGDQGRGNVHIDASDWSAILYLTLPEHCQGGTDFFRHKATNMDHAPVTQEDMDATGFKSFQELIEKIMKPDSNDPSKWEHIMRIPMRFNRLVMLRPWLWHNAGSSFGNSIENGRLVYLMFFDEPEPLWTPITG